MTEPDPGTTPEAPEPLEHILRVQDGLSTAIRETAAFVDALGFDEKIAVADDVRKIMTGISRAAEACVAAAASLQFSRVESSLTRIFDHFDERSTP